MESGQERVYSQTQERPETRERPEPQERQERQANPDLLLAGIYNEIGEGLLASARRDEIRQCATSLDNILGRIVAREERVHDPIMRVLAEQAVRALARLKEKVGVRS